MKAISTRQPWAWLIVHGYKDIDNRTWPTKYRGCVFIHASKRKISDTDWNVASKIAKANNIPLPERDSPEYKYGGIIGAVNMTGCCESSDSPWFWGPIGFQLSNAKEISFIPFKGRLNFFETNLDL
ncbi:ASCH domain-containing protein [Dickeya sp. NCPPB 3274]|uniref:ASCH domain-containing protein n=1 Tax=Dickeya sp. NCPPB 3274 TaxID=568766 RepID=UPI0008FBDBA7|nr:ASCH domain-containing protein [Dickeya sp. NCPPB 3274]